MEGGRQWLVLRPGGGGAGAELDMAGGRDEVPAPGLRDTSAALCWFLVLQSV